MVHSWDDILVMVCVSFFFSSPYMMLYIFVSEYQPRGVWKKMESSDLTNTSYFCDFFLFKTIYLFIYFVIGVGDIVF